MRVSWWGAARGTLTSVHRDHDTRAAAPPLHQLLDRVRQRQPATEGAGGRVWRDDGEVVLTRVAPLLAVTLLALCAVLVALGWLVTDVLDDSAFGRADLALVRDLAENRTGALDAVTGAATWLANTTFVLAVMVGGAAVAARRTRRWVAPVFLVAAVGGEKLVYLVVSLLVGRDRPPVPTLGYVHATTSFPSGHVGAAVALYGSIALLLLWSPGTSRAARVAAVAVAVVAPPLVGFARVYRGVHYATDVVAGSVMGAVWLTVIWYVLARQFAPDASARPQLHRTTATA